MDNNSYYNYEYESSHDYTQNAYIPPYGYTPTDGTSSFNLTPPFTTNELPLTPKDNTPVQQNLSSARQRNTRESCKNWQSHEDEALCKAWLHVSEDAIVGTNQKRDSLWSNIKNIFEEMLGYKTTHTTSALNSRFKTIQLDLNKYSACVLRVQTTPTSGFNAADNEIAAKHIFQETHGKPFRLEACWAIVKDTAKWYHYVKGVKGRQHKGDTNNYPFDLNSENSGADECMRTPDGRPSPSSVNLSDDGSPFSQFEGLELPPGRKASKARKQKAKPYNVNLLSEDILGYEARSNELYERDVALKAAAEERKRNFIRSTPKPNNGGGDDRGLDNVDGAICTARRSDLHRGGAICIARRSNMLRARPRASSHSDQRWWWIFWVCLIMF
ncbi:hypothetical protein Q3G72_029740 [Acer saccharum]|nr:hypothetical protein Q3G72_029740 [Acer saccharum]